VTERLSHGAPTWFVRDRKSFVQLWLDGHHDIEYTHMWCAAPPGAQQELIAEDPALFFRPPYVGQRGWLGVRLDGQIDEAGQIDGAGQIDEAQLRELCLDAYRTVAPKWLIGLLES